MLGISANKKFNHLIILDGSILYHIKTDGDQDYEFGDIIRATIGATINVIDKEKKPTLNLLSEVISQFANKDEREGETVRDSGGTTIFLPPDFLSTNRTVKDNTISSCSCISGIRRGTSRIGF